MNYRYLDGVEVKSAHGDVLLDLTKYTKTDKDKTGIGYILPFKQRNKYNTLIFFQSFAEGGEYINHFEWWSEHLVNVFIKKNNIQEPHEDLSLAYTGLPRFRIEKVEGKFRIFYGNNICNKIRTMILRVVGLKSDEVEWYYDHHETISKTDEKIIKASLQDDNIDLQNYCY